MSKGSTWNIWDFHLHTPFSVLNNQFGDLSKDETWESYISQVETKTKEKGIVALGITDYFTIEGYKRVQEFQKAGRLKNIFIFPNIEFRIDKIVYRGKDNSDPKRLNLHVLLSPEILPAKIEEGFLHDLDFVHVNDPFEPSKTRKLKIANLTEFGETLQADHAKFKEVHNSPFETGCVNAVVQAHQIKELLDNKFRGKYLLVLAEENTSLMDWDGQDHATRKQLIQMSHAFFSSNEKTRNFGLGKTHSSTEAYLNEFRSLKPCIWGCDSHGFNERFLEPDQKWYCWIKSEVTWEGLKQILYEPEDRVRIQEDNPEPDKSIYTVEKVEITQTKINDVLSVNGFDIEFNPNLVTIIGGRGSGKTALLDLIATCFQEGSKLAKMENSFFHRLYVGDGSKKHLSNQPVKVDVGFKSGEEFSKSIGFDESYFEKANIIYLTQNHFDEYSASPDKLNSHIIDLVFEKYADDERKYKEMEDEVDELEQKIQTINLEIEHLRSEVAGQKEIEENNRRIKGGERADYTQRITDIEQKQGGSDDAILKLTEQLDKLKAKKRTIESLLYNLTELAEDIETFRNRYSQSVADINNDLVTLAGNAQVKPLPIELSDLKTTDELITYNKIVLAQTETETEASIQAADKEIDDLEGVSRVIADFRQRVNNISAEIDDIENRIKDILANEQRISDLDQERFNTYAAIMAKMVGLRLFLQEMISKFETGKDEMLSKLKSSALIDMRKSSDFIETLAEKVDNRMDSEASLRREFTPIFENMSTLMNSSDPATDFSGITASISTLVRSLRLKRSTTDSDFYNAVLRKFFGIGLKIEFNNKALSELSMGERAMVLLKILLALDDKPLLIDQPEEHLDNRYIYDELTPAFRSAKTRRQIIIATHNANLVVNTDAEQVIIAEHTNGMLSYKAGTLEDLVIRDSVKTILEGGDEAFKKREEKYGYKF